MTDPDTTLQMIDAFDLIIWLFLLMAVIGYILNIVRLVHNRDRYYAARWIRVLGVVFPILGAYLGYQSDHREPGRRRF